MWSCSLILPWLVVQQRMDSETTTLKEHASWETTSRLLVSIINEGLVKLSVTRLDHANATVLRLEPTNDSENDAKDWLVEVPCSSQLGEVTLPLSIGDLDFPVMGHFAGVWSGEMHLDPATLSANLFPSFKYDAAYNAQILAEIRSSAALQGG